jgi:hypothetical protein
MTRQTIPSIRQSGLRRIFLNSALAMLFCCAASSCGDDSDSPMPDGGSSGTGGKSGGGAGQGGSAAGAPAPKPVPCGSNTCYPPPNALSGLLGGMALPIALPMPAACCVDESKGTCGTAAMEGAACEVMATPDPRCPGINLGALGAAAGGLGNLATGCCTASGQCGLNGMLFGRGCVDNAEVGSIFGPLGGLIMVPAAMPCDHPQDDAGSSDAGS